MSKFKVGDKVRILDGSKIENYAGGWTPKMGRYVGEVYKVANVVHYSSGSSMYEYELEGVAYVWDERGLERCGNETIVIYRKDNEVIALDKRTGKKASTTVEDMRKSLTSYCFGRSCCNCKLKSQTYRCGRGAHFMTKDGDGNYTMSNRDIKAAFNIVFGTGIKEVKRHAKVGEYIKIVDAFLPYGHYKNGDILQIVDDTHGYARYGHKPNEVLYDEEYVVLEGYKPDKHSEPKEPHKFKVGDIVKGNSKSDGRYNFTNSNMTRGKVTRVTGDTITIEVLKHKTMHGKVEEKYDVDPKYFDLVEETTKLYNGKIVFTKGDGIFETGHIYEVKNGRMRHELVPMGEPLKDIEDVKDYFTGNWDGNRKRENGWSSYTLELMEVKED